MAKYVHEWAGYYNNNNSNNNNNKNSHHDMKAAAATAVWRSRVHYVVQLITSAIDRKTVNVSNRYIESDELDRFDSPELRNDQGTRPDFLEWTPTISDEKRRTYRTYFPSTILKESTPSSPWHVIKVTPNAATSIATTTNRKPRIRHKRSMQ